MDEQSLKNLLQSKEWQVFAQAARERDFDPVFLIFDFMRGCVEVWESMELDEEISRHVQAYIEKHGDFDPVELVKQVRREKQARLEAEQREAHVFDAAA